MKICTVIGARPQFIKASAVTRVLQRHSTVEEVTIHTGQHYDHDMSEVFFDELEIPAPRYNLAIGSASHGKQTGEMLAKIEEKLLAEMPDWVLVYGDTNSTLAGALAGVKLNIPVAHVEAGLRSFNKTMPEEINRIVTDSVSTLLFAPTISAREQLKNEGRQDDQILLVGDVMYDVMLQTVERASKQSRILEKNKLRPDTYLLATIHRAENTDDASRLTAIIESLTEVSLSLDVCFPLHPRTLAALKKFGLFDKAKARLKFLSPVGYFDMLALLNGAKVVATDSGGLQKEAFFVQKPCFTFRNETEWTELVEGGWNRLVPPVDVVSMISQLDSVADFECKDISPYGDGTAALEMVDALISRSKRQKN